MIKKGLFSLSVILLLSCGIQNIVFAKIDMQLVPDTSHQKSFLLIQVADSAELKKITEKNHSRYILTMYNLHPHVMYFSTRPKHIAGMITIKKFFELWSKAKIRSRMGHTNAGMIGATFDAVGNRGVKSGFIVLSNPQYNVEDNSVQYDVLQKKGEFNIQPGKYHEASLFIYEIIVIGKEWKLAPILRTK